MVKVKPKKGEVQLPFDHLRASINLVVSAVLIASATSLKLPLSTTYVTFMVAMGSSLADGAWDRENAVYRINGVLSVIGSWFLTALFAFLCCAIIVVAFYFGGIVTPVLFMAITSFILLRSNFFSKSKTNDNELPFEKADKISICNHVNNSVSASFNKILSIYKAAMTDFLDEDVSKLRKERNKAIQLKDELTQERAQYYAFSFEDAKDKVDSDARYYYYRIFTNLKELGHDLKSVVGTAYNHINNNHSVYRGTLRENLLAMMTDLEDLLNFLDDYARSPLHRDELVTKRTEESNKLISSLQHQLLTRIDKHKLSLRSSELYLSYLRFSRNVINCFSLVALLQHELNEKCRMAQEGTGNE
jgi:hypothetical protein